MASCPRCGYPWYCGCAACAPRNSPGILIRIHSIIRRGKHTFELETCGNCGFTQTSDWWFDYDWYQAGLLYT